MWELQVAYKGLTKYLDVQVTTCVVTKLLDIAKKT